MIENLLITQNAQFFRAETALTTAGLLSILESASDNKEADTDFIINLLKSERPLPDGSGQYTFSIRVFPSTRPVYFIDSDLFDTIYAYIIVIELGENIAILKKSCASISDACENHLTAITSNSLTASFSDDDAEFQKIALRNMTISDRAMRARAYEAADLKGLLSTHAAGRSIPYFFKIKISGTTKTISSQTGRVVESSERRSLDEIALWAKQQFVQINNPSLQKTFLDSFAKMIDLDEVWQHSRPSAILIENSYIVDQLINTQTPLKYTTRRGRKLDLTQKNLNKLTSTLEKVYEIAPDLSLDSPQFPAKIRKNKSSISLISRTLQNISLQENGKDITLQAYISKHLLTTICFEDPKYMYFMGKCFEDSAGISEIPSLLDILQPHPQISRSTSEKGTFDANSIQFDRNCVFGAIEEIHNNDDFLFCDDLGNEWADHISLNSSNPSISFIHSKHGDPSCSASNLHDVVGQGIKNLGNMYFTKDQMLHKRTSKFRNLYSGTRISRTRLGSGRHLGRFIDSLLQDYRLNRRCILACSFLSKSMLQREFSRIQRGERVPGNVTQLLWIISSFAHAAKEMNIIPIIYCSP
ncbi:hypothetical protein ACKI1H_15860 [Pseudomonas sp. YH-1]|uniref:hypothetical protein n=1 Tax=Pseudomonas sp. YH-1 TaxID=3384787 RepID=UPI003F7F5238